MQVSEGGGEKPYTGSISLVRSNRSVSIAGKLKSMVQETKGEFFLGLCPVFLRTHKLFNRCRKFFVALSIVTGTVIAGVTVGKDGPRHIPTGTLV